MLLTLRRELRRRRTIFQFHVAIHYPLRDLLVPRAVFWLVVDVRRGQALNQGRRDQPHSRIQPLPSSEALRLNFAKLAIKIRADTSTVENTRHCSTEKQPAWITGQVGGVSPSRFTQRKWSKRRTPIKSHGDGCICNRTSGAIFPLTHNQEKVNMEWAITHTAPNVFGGSGVTTTSRSWLVVRRLSWLNDSYVFTELVAWWLAEA